MSWPTVLAGELMLKRGGSINPKKFPDETFELYSIPAHDKGQPEILAGSDIGSSKSCIQPNDILLSKIVPHIRRCWVVVESGSHRLIGSGEWIVFRSDKVYPKYLKYFLTSDIFHKQFMNTVAGVGGSLVRARPAEVERILIPLPPLTEQKRIAAILDKADQLRQKRQQAIALADDFLRSVFLDMFGDLAFNPYDYQRVSLDSLSVNDGIKCGPFGTQLGKHEYLAEGVPLWGIKHVNRDFKVETDEYLSAPKAIALKAYSIRPDDIVMTRKGTVGNCHVYPEHMPEGIMHSDLLRIRVDESIIDPYFLSWQLKLSRDVSHQISLISSGAIMAGINVTKLKNIEVYVPELAQQIKFREILFKKGKLTQKYSQGDLALFDALSQKAFAGEL